MAFGLFNKLHKTHFCAPYFAPPRLLRRRQLPPSVPRSLRHCNAHIESPSDTPSLPVSIAATVNFALMQTRAANDCWGRAKPDVRPPGAAISSAKSIQVVEIPLVAMAVGILPLLREEFGLLKLILHSKLRRRAASRRALPCPSNH